MAGREWYSPAEDVQGLLFDGAPELLRLIDDLYRRPWRFSTEKLLPIIYLTVPRSGADPLSGLKKRLSDVPGGPVQQASIGTKIPPSKPSQDSSNTAHPAEPKAAPTVAELLDDAVAQLGAKYRHRRRLRFPHYVLASWLLNLKMLNLRDSKGSAKDRTSDEITDKLKRYMKEYRFPNIVVADIGDITVGVPWWVWLALRLPPKPALQLMWATWRPTRWLVDHSLMERRSNKSFYQVARWFLSTDHAAKEPREVQLLLVDAFLEDLRRAYRRTSILGVGRRRTSYPVLLVGAFSGGETEISLLELIDDVRIDVASARLRRGRGRNIALDPLLIIAAGYQPNTKAQQSGPPADALPIYQDWTGDLLTAGRGLTWFLNFQIPREGKIDGARHRLGQVLLYRLRRPWMSYATNFAVLGALAGVLVGVPLTNPARCQPRWAFSLSADLERVPLANGRYQCIGISEDAEPFDPSLDDTWRKIEETNAKAITVR